MSAPATAGELRLPPERFYWALLEPHALPRGSRRRRRSLGYLFESVLPVPIETIYAVYREIGEGRVLACGLDRDTLREHAGAGATVLGPAALPEFAGTPDASPRDHRTLNLLVGPHEPTPSRRGRTRVTGIVCAAIALSAIAIAWGQFRRAAHLDKVARSIRDAGAAVYDGVLPPSASQLPASARLTAELRSLEGTRGVRPDTRAPREITPVLAAVLTSWPGDLHVTTDALSASSTAITMAVRLEDEASAERFERALKPPPGWRLSQPNVQREREGITVRVRMEPEGGR